MSGFFNGLTEFYNSFQGSSNDTLSECESSIDHYKFYQFSLIPSVIFTMLMAATTKRKEKMLGFLSGRPGLLFPMDSLTRGSRLSYSCAFGSTALLVYKVLIDQKFAINYDGPIALKTLIAILSMVIYGTVFFPVFGSLALGTAFSYGLGTLLVWMFTVIDFYLVCECDYSLGWRALVITRNLPSLLCNTYLSISLPVRFVRACIKGEFVNSTDSSIPKDTLTVGDVRSSYQGKHVRKLLKKAVIKDPPEGFGKKLKTVLLGFLHNWIYHKEGGFRYPSRLLSVMITAGIVVYVLTVELLITFISILGSTMDNLGLTLDVIGWDHGPNDPKELKDFRDGFVAAHYIAETLQTCLIVSTCLATTCSVLTMLHMLSSYRANLYAMYKGDYRLIPSPYEKSAASLCVGSIKYAGFQVAYIVWAYFITFFVLFILILILAILIILLAEGYTDWLVNKVLQLWPGLVITISLMILQNILATKVFLQGNGQWLRLNNRRFFFVFTYFMFFYNIFLGLVSCLLRILKAIVVGVLFLARLDNSTLPRKFEFFDPGFSAYQGYIHMEAAHTHPVVIVFIQLLHALSIDSKRIISQGSQGTIKVEVDSPVREKQSNGVKTADIALDVLPNGATKPDSDKAKSANFSARSNWWVAYTLLQNPQVRIYRKGFMQAMHKARKEGLRMPISDKPISDFDLVKLQMEKDKERQEEGEVKKALKARGKHSVGALIANKLPDDRQQHHRNDGQTLI